MKILWQFIMIFWLPILIAILTIISLIMLSHVSGCAALQTKPDVLPKPGTDFLVKTIIKTNWLLTFSIIGVGAGFFAFLNGNGKGLNIMASCFIVLSLVLCIAKFAVWIAAVAMLGAVALMAFTILTRKKALKEVVKGGQELKKEEAELYVNYWTSFKELFNGYQESAQSSSTTKLVEHIKKQLKKGETKC